MQPRRHTAATGAMPCCVLGLLVLSPWQHSPPDEGLRMTHEHVNLPEEPEETPPLLSHIMERNIRTITRLRLQTARERTVQERLADAITSFSGSMLFVYLHILWFGAWLLVNTGHVGIPQFDPFPYGLLTMIVSLEAIFLSIFVLISQQFPEGLEP